MNDSRSSHDTKVPHLKASQEKLCLIYESPLEQTHLKKATDSTKSTNDIDETFEIFVLEHALNIYMTLEENNKKLKFYEQSILESIEHI